MSTLTICDHCGKKETSPKGWSSLSVRTGELKIKGLEGILGDYFNFCPQCGKIVLTKINKILNKKYGKR